MSIYFGNDTVNDLYIRLTPVTKGYVGTHLFYNGDNTIIELTYEKYILNTQSSTLYNTAEKPVKSAILKGNTKYRDIDTGDILDTFDETKNLELVSVQMPVLTTSNEDGTKTNILTVNEPIELRGIGDVQDTLDCLTGELTQRIGEIVLDGSENWSPYGNKGIFITKLSGLNSGQANTNWIKTSCLSDNMPIRNHQDNKVYGNTHNTNAISTGGDEICINLKGETTENITKEYVKTWLSQNPITVQYQLATESIKTVDLSIVNQDGNDTNLSTFNDITHVMVSSGGLIPVVELEVATKNEEVLNTMSLEMDNISTTQNTLEETSNAQSENVDATMIATTEIYEQLL